MNGKELSLIEIEIMGLNGDPKDVQQMVKDVLLNSNEEAWKSPLKVSPLKKHGKRRRHLNSNEEAWKKMSPLKKHGLGPEKRLYSRHSGPHRTTSRRWC